MTAPPSPALDHRPARLPGPRPEAADHRRGVERRRVDGLLRGVAADQRPQQVEQLPLVLLVPAGSAERGHRLAPAQQHGRAQRRARPLAGPQGGRAGRVQPGHLQPGAEAEAQLGHGRRGLQPAAGRGRGHHVARTGRRRPGGRCLRGSPRSGRPSAPRASRPAAPDGCPAARSPAAAGEGRRPAEPAGAELVGGGVADQRGPLGGVRRCAAGPSACRRAGRVAVEAVPVGQARA